MPDTNRDQESAILNRPAGDAAQSAGDPGRSSGDGDVAVVGLFAMPGSLAGDAGRFDAGFFDVAASDAASPGSCRGAVLEVAWNALEDAGMRASALRGRRIGVFFAAADGAGSRLASRVSRCFDLRGPSEVSDAGPLAAVHRAAMALRHEECETVLAGGFGPEGDGMLVLKPLRRALAERHDIRAIIRRSTAGHAGAAGDVAAPTEMTERGGVQELRSAAADIRPVIDIMKGMRPAGGGPLPPPVLVSGLSAGGGGTHLLVEPFVEPGARADASRTGITRLYPISARTAEALTARARLLADAVRSRPELDPADVAFTLHAGREPMPYRLAVAAESLEQLAARLDEFVSEPHSTSGAAHGVAGRDRLPGFGTDPEDEDYIAALVAGGKWRKLADLWVAGVDIRWTSVLEGSGGRRIALPVYPFHPAAPSRSAPSATVMSMVAEAVAPAGDAAAVSFDATPAELGIDSLAAMEIRARVRDGLDMDLSIAELLAATSIGSLADVLSERGIDRASPRVAFAPAGPAERYDPFPLTDVQLAYLVGRSDVRAFGGIGCQVYWEFERPRYDIVRLETAWNRVVERHDMLRAVFGADGRQRVLAEVPPCVIDLYDWSAISAEDAEARCRALARDLAGAPFDTGGFPLFRLAVSRTASGDRLHVVFDLAIADGPSLFLLLNEWADLYERPGRTPAPLGVSFRDYVLHQERLKAAAAFEADEAYWMDRLDDLPLAPMLPVLPEPPSSMRFHRLDARLDPPTWRDLSLACGERGLTPALVAMTAFADAVAAWTDRPEFCLNVTVANRQPIHSDIAGVVGDFTRNLLLAVPGRDDAGFTAHARRLGRQLAADLEHVGFSAVRLMAALARTRRDAAMMPVVFTSLLGYDALLKRPAPFDALGAFRDGVTQTPQVWMDAQVAETAGGLYLSIDVADGIYPPDVVRDIFGRFVHRLRRLAETPSAWDEPPRPRLPTAALRARRLANRTAVRLPREPIHAGFCTQASAAPERCAVIAPDRRLSYGELLVEAGRLASRLKAEGIGRNTPVAVVMEKGWQQIVAVLGISLAGAAYLPIELPLPPDRVAQLLALGNAAAAVIARRDTGQAAWPCPVLTLDELAEGTALETPAPEDMAYIIFTSGSTGQPKGVVMAHGAVANTLHDINTRFGVGPDDRVLALSSLSFDLSVYDIFGVLGVGGAVVVPDPSRLRDPAYIAELAAREGVTLWNSTPSFLQLTVEAATARLPASLRLVMLSGDWIPLALARRMLADYPATRLVSLGGATEAAIWSICQPITAVEQSWASIPYGKPLANQRFHVLDAGFADCPVGEPGELYIAGDGLAEGYWRDPERTAASFLHHPDSGERLYRTGDWGRYLHDGTIEFLGRRDQQVKIGGFRVELGEVEAALLACPGVGDAVAVAVEDAVGQKRLAAAVRGGGEIEVRSFLATRLPAHMVPSVILVLESLPLTANAKVDRRVIVELAAARLGRRQAGAPLTMPERPSAATPGDMAAALAADPDVIRDSTARAAFLREERGIRGDLSSCPATALPGPPAGELVAAYRHVSTRRFAAGGVALETLAELLAPLRGVEIDGRRRYRFPSAGGAYPLQLYLQLAEAAPGGPAAGLYYYHPVQHRMLALGPAAAPLDALHLPANRFMAAEAAFSLYLFADLAAIRPLYGAASADMARLEAGHVGQLLSDAAADLGLGFCAVGMMDWTPLRAALRLGPDMTLLYAFVGGPPTKATVEPPTSVPVVAVPTAPVRAELTAAVFQAWRDVLGFDGFGADENFFEAGGNSFLAVELQGKLAPLTAAPLTVTDLFRHPTVNAQARRLADGATTEPTNPAASPSVPAPDAAASRRALRLAARAHRPPAR